MKRLRGSDRPYLNVQLRPDFGPDGSQPVGNAAAQAGELTQVLGQLHCRAGPTQPHTQTCTVNHTHRPAQ